MPNLIPVAGRPSAGRRAAARAALLVAMILTLPALAVAGPLSRPAAAHTELRSSTPAKNAKVAAPSQVQLAFTDKLRASLVKIQLLAANGTRHESGAPSVEGGTVTQKVRGPLPAGQYAVVYWVISADGHPVKGEVPFTVTGAPGAGQPGETAGDPGARDTAPARSAAPGWVRWIWMFAGLFAGIGVGIGVVLWRKKAAGR